MHYNRAVSSLRDHIIDTEATMLEAVTSMSAAHSKSRAEPIATSTIEPLRTPASLGKRIATMIAIVVPLAAVLVTPLYVWEWGFRWTDLAVLVGMYVLTALGVTIGFHRLFVHRSFETYLWVKVVLAVMGSMALQGPLLRWVGLHRWHHQHSDTPEDPHSPQHGGAGFVGLAKGFWHAQIGWFFEADPPNLARYSSDLSKSRTLRVISALFPLWVALGLVLPAVVGGLLSQSWMGALSGLIWGGLVRIFLVHHVTWSVNSACHLWGSQPYKSDDESRNNALFGVLAMGEGWHNTHHAFPTSARHGLRWWEIDLSYWVIDAMARLSLVWDVKLPTPDAQAKGRRLA